MQQKLVCCVETVSHMLVRRYELGPKHPGEGRLSLGLLKLLSSCPVLSKEMQRTVLDH